MKKIKTYIFVITCFFSLYAYPQDSNNPEEVKTDSATNLNGFEYLNLKIPALAVFLESAKTSPDAEYYKEIINEKKLNIKTEKREILNTITPYASIQYGNVVSNREESSDFQTISTYQATLNNYYSVGLQVSVPLNYIFDRKNKIHKVNLQIAQNKRLYEQTVLLKKKEIVDTYSKVLTSYNTLKTALESYTLTTSTVNFLKIDYLNGKVDIFTLNDAKQREAVQLSRVEAAKSEFLIQINILELITNIKIMQ